MTAKGAPKERTARWMPFPVDWTADPKSRRLRKADPANEGRWLHLLCKATHCCADGRLVTPLGTPMGAEDLAYDHDREDEAWAAFIKLCTELDLLNEDAGVLVITRWDQHNRQAANEAEREAAAQRKRIQRAEDKAKEAEAAARDLQAQNEALERQLAEARAYLNSPLPSTPPASVSQPVTECHKMSRPRLDLDQKRLDLEEILDPGSPRAREDAPTPPPSPRPVETARSQRILTEVEFFSQISTLHRCLTEATQGKARKLPNAEQVPLLKRLDQAPWAELERDYATIATAIGLGVERTLSAIGTGHLQTAKPWLEALTCAESCIPEALAQVGAAEEARAAGMSPPELKPEPPPDELAAKRKTVTPPRPRDPQPAHASEPPGNYSAGAGGGR